MLMYRILLAVAVLFLVTTHSFAQSDPRNPNVVLILADGLGRGHTILVKNYSGSQSPTGLEQQAIPEGMDWNRFCDQAPLVDYHERLHRRWRGYNIFTGGPICDRGSHALDMVHLAMGWENVAPRRIEPTTEAKNERERGVQLHYPGGTVVRLESDGGPAFGGIFVGEKGKMEINRGRFACNPTTLLAPFEGEESENHVANWLDCIESRQEPDDSESLVRLMVHSDLLEIESLTARLSGQGIPCDLRSHR
ncbi:Gfo/Idh/MocA family oxidoreductase [Stieleria sp. ICT_E10.1]|uniref:Gfo/Idh/MocA family oxidoreductase n=1 Tax=Stieleria sedimenti TaxID=2976331 RepID=UPI002180374F|nr:Gfo/Idh/MocA family oxidoreductase [Stieleria sedimenti]MCS7469994.1 Gfo/Idh/MocA family oxidoreductase [Stieleria sedimenti]